MDYKSLRFSAQLPLEKPEPNDSLIEPKSEYLEDPEESVEDLTLDDDMNDLNEMDQDNNRAGPSHDPSQHPGKLKLKPLSLSQCPLTRPVNVVEYRVSSRIHVVHANLYLKLLSEGRFLH